MKTPLPLRLFFALLTLACVACIGCARTSDEAQSLDVWTLDGQPVHLPVHLGSRVEGQAAYTLHARVQPRSPLTLSIGWLPATVSLRVDGRAVPPLDNPLSDRFRSAGPHRWRIPDELAARPELDLELRVENTWTQASWLDSVPRLSRTVGGDRAFLTVAAFDQAIAGVSVTIIAVLSLLYLALYLRDRTRTQNLWFALEGTGALWYPAMMGGLLQPVFGTADVAVAGPLLSFSAVATAHFTHEYLHLPRPGRIWWIGLAGVVLASVLRGGPFEATLWVAPATMAMVVANAVHHLWLLRVVLRSGKRPTNLYIVTLSWPIASLLGATDFIAWLGLGDPFGGLRAGCLGMSTVAVLQSIALTGEHVKSLHAVETLNEELRRQIAARSKQLADALARLGSAVRKKAELGAGSVVDGRYVVARELGQGGAGRVYEVERRSDGQRLALKVVTATGDPMMLARAAREAQLACEVRHPNVVSIVDVDVSSDGYMFLVMELVDGRSLREERSVFGHPSLALPVLRQIAKGLAAIHARGIVHRDLKPANVLLAGPDGNTAAVVKIADFGIANLAAEAAEPASMATPTLPARAVGEDTPTVAERAPQVPADPLITATGDLLGTPHYMAPEVVPGGMKAAQPPADIFAFGVIAFELLSGHRPYETMPTFLGVTISPAPAAFATLAPALPEGTARMLDACLSKEPGARPTAAELVEALEG